MNEHFFTCPYCFSEISMFLDFSILQQTYIEDCETCCNPIEIYYKTDGFSIVEFEAKSIEQ